MTPLGSNPQAALAFVQDVIGDGELGRYGQKTGSGYYQYAADRRGGEADPFVEELIAAYRLEKGIQPRIVIDEEIVDRCILALVNESWRILEEKIAQRASDIDLVYLP